MREALASGKDVIMRIDVQGAATIRKLVPNAVTIFLTSESEEELVRRLEKRKTEDAGQAQDAHRHGSARAAARQGVRLRGRQSLDRLDETVDQVRSIIAAEKCRVDWTPVI